MPFPDWTDEHNQLRDVARDFAEREIAPYAHQWDKVGRFPRDIFTQLA